MEISLVQQKIASAYIAVKTLFMADTSRWMTAFTSLMLEPKEIFASSRLSFIVYVKMKPGVKPQYNYLHNPCLLLATQYFRYKPDIIVAHCKALKCMKWAHTDYLTYRKCLMLNDKEVR